MKKLLVGLFTVFMLSGCHGNSTIIDTNYTFDKAIVKMPNGEVKEFKIKKWSDYEGEQIQITTEEGDIYLFSTFNCVLINEAGE